ncbi:MAG: chemotaxis-specific protein-glutamate methyltransferase CheB [Pseudomonadota bacterium]
MPATEADIPTLVVDDTLLYRLMVTEAVDHIDGFRVVGKADNGRTGLQAVKTLLPKLVLLDLEMPVMDGFEMLTVLKREHPDITVLIISSLSKRGGRVTLDALQRGAFDFITKPEESDAKASRAELLKQLQTKLEPLRQRRVGGSAPRPASPASLTKPSAAPASKTAVSSTSAVPASVSTSAGCDAAKRMRIDVIGIGISTGGPQALTTLLPQLKPGLPPICIVQHMPGPFLTAMAEKLDSLCELHVVEAADGDTLLRDTVYIAPGGRQMAISKPGIAAHVELRDDPPENHCLPAADYLLRSLAKSYGRNALGAVLTGMGVDGAQGLLLMKEAGALTIAQNEATCTVYGMPKQAVRIGAAAFELPLNGVAQVFRSAG